MVINPKNPQKLVRFLKSKQLVLYGMGETGIRISKWCDKKKIQYLFADKNAVQLQKNSKSNVITPQSIVCEHADANIVVSSIVYNNEIMQDLLALGIKKNQIYPYTLFMQDEVSLQELEDNGLVNWERMRSRYKKILSWGWIPNQIESVADYSAGENFILKSFLPLNAIYYPIDYMDRGKQTIICDFNRRQFPKILAEMSACFAMLMYTEPANELVAHICEYTKHTIILSAITIEGLPDVGVRRRSGMCKDFTEQQIEMMFLAHNFKINDKKYDTAGNSTMTFFLFQKSGDKN